MIVVASGYFDPLHAGHVEYLELAKKLGDKLIVIVNNDTQCIHKNGGFLLSVYDRLKIIRALRCVDAAIISVDSDGSVRNTLQAIMPDIFANGGDKHQGNVPEATICTMNEIQMVDGLGEKIDSSSRIRRELEERSEE